MNGTARIIHIAIAATFALACGALASDKIASGVAPPAVEQAPVTLPADPRIASATAELRKLLEGRKANAGEVCRMDNEKAGAMPVYDCACYADRVVLTTLDVGSTISHAGVAAIANLEPPIELVVQQADLHACLDAALLPKRAYDKGRSMAGMYPNKKDRLAQCTSDDAMAAYKAKPSHDIWSFDNVVLGAYGGCVTKVR